MKTISTTIDIESSPTAVWNVLTDFEAYPDWNPVIREASGTVAVGETLTLKMFPSPTRGMTIHPRVLAADPGTELRWRGQLVMPGIFDGEHSFVIGRAPGGGGTRLVHGERFTGILVPFLGKLIARTEANFRSLNEALKKRVETS